MASQTKMVIITSDEDIIRQFSINKSRNTHIIDLDDEPTVNGMPGNNMINMAFLAELCQPTSKNDQVYKRALDSSDDNPTKAVKASKKSMEMICVICGHHAIGFNYNVLSCASCKAFFRRNAILDPKKIRCLTGQGQCPVAHGVLHRCQKCRLERCLAAGMRKDFFLTKEEKDRRRKRSKSQNPASESATSSSTVQSTSNLESSLPAMDGDLNLQSDKQSNEMEDLLSVEDWITIESVHSSFLSAFEFPPKRPANVHIDLSTRASALISWSEFGNQNAMECIDFLRQIVEFQNLLLDDRLILVKYNLLAIVPLCRSHHLKQTNDYHSSNAPDQVKYHQQILTLLDAPYTIFDTFRDVVISIGEITAQDSKLLSLLLIVLFLTPGLSMSEDEPPLNNPLAVNRAQSHYTRLLWNYFVSQWGEIEACRRFTQLLTLVLRLQLASKTARLFFRDQCVQANTADKLAPLMQSILHIS